MADLLPQETLDQASASARRLIDGLDAVLLGRHQLHQMVAAAVLSQGHVLLEGMPGLGKTEMIKTLGRILGLQFRRVQFTPDLMPADILGAHILQTDEKGARGMTFQPGPVFTNILLADEINRASPKTQAALLEAMQEQSVTFLGTTRTLPSPFFVLASQNPIDLEGTYPLPEAQLDRFLFKLQVEALDVETMAAIVGTRRRGRVPEQIPRLSAQELERLFAAMDGIYLPKAVAHYIARLVNATHPAAEEAGELVNQYVAFGASPRGAIAIAEAARAYALIQGRNTVGFEDVKAVAAAALNHRIITGYQAKIDRIDGSSVVADLLARLEPSNLKLPGPISVSKY